MKKVIEIHAVDEDIATRARALWLLNEFKTLGFKERKEFVTKIMESCEALNNYNGSCRLNNFWAGRDYSINKHLEKVLRNLESYKSQSLKSSTKA